MRQQVQLRKPTLSDELAITKFVFEFISEGEDSIPGSAGLLKLNFNGWIESLKEREACEPTEDLVPAVTFLFVDIVSDKIIGIVDLRLALNEWLRKYGGNIGYSIRPSERCKGYGAMQLALINEVAKEYGLTEVMLTCDEDNDASRNTILANNGRFHGTCINENGVIVEQYYISL